MRVVSKMTMIRAMGVLPLAACCVAFLNSCKDKCPTKTESTEAAVRTEAAETRETKAVESQDRELLDYMIFQVGEKLRKEAEQPMLRETVRDMRNEVEAYYNKQREAQGNTERLVRIRLFLADAARELGAFEKALGIYSATAKDWEALPEEVRNGTTGRRIQSFLESGMASCLMQQRKMNDALSHYEKALQLDKERYHRLVPDDAGELPPEDQMTEEVKHAAADLLASYRCLAECQLFSDEPELARETLVTADKAAQRMKSSVGEIVLEHIKLLSTAGNLESRVGEQEKALAAWERAAQYAKALRMSSPSSTEQVQATRFFNGLNPSINAVRTQLRRQNAEKERQRQEQEQQPEPTPEQQQPEPAAEAPAA